MTVYHLSVVAVNENAMPHPQEPPEDKQQQLPIPDEQTDKTPPLDINTVDVMGLAKAHDIEQKMKGRTRF